MSSLRWIEISRIALVRAFVWSILLHLLLFIGIELAIQFDWRSKFQRIPGLKTIAELIPRSDPPKPKPVEVDPEVQLVFVDVDPNRPPEPAPEDTPYYSVTETRAANPDTGDEEVADLDGEQDKVFKTTVRSEPPPPAPPVPPPVPAEPEAEADPSPAPEPELEAEPESAPTTEVDPVAEPEPAPESLSEPEPGPDPDVPEPLGPSALAMTTPTMRPRVAERADEDDEEELKKAAARIETEAPRTVAEALRRKALLSGQPMKQEGGVRRHGLESTIDVRSTPFASYDAAVIEAIQRRWYQLLDQNSFANNRTGKVVLDFRLHADGSVRDLAVAETTVGEVLALMCRRAVVDPSPYMAWTRDMRRVIGRDSRAVRFTFYFNY